MNLIIIALAALIALGLVAPGTSTGASAPAGFGRAAADATPPPLMSPSDVLQSGGPSH